MRFSLYVFVMVQFAESLVQSSDVKQLITMLSQDECIALLAPSFVVDFSFATIAPALRALGFDLVSEVTFGAKMVSQAYHQTIKDTQHLHISSACPGIVQLVHTKFPSLKKQLVQVDSPMVAMGKIMKTNYPDKKTVFIGPCTLKKQEAKKSSAIDHAITFQELHELFASSEQSPHDPLFQNKKGFDSFYNDYTKIYPLAGGLSESMHYHNILARHQVKVSDDIKSVITLLQQTAEGKLESDVRFLDVLTCKGGCIGGPGIATTDSLEKRHERVEAYQSHARHSKVGGTRVGLNKYVNDVTFTHNYE